VTGRLLRGSQIRSTRLTALLVSIVQLTDAWVHRESMVRNVEKPAVAKNVTADRSMINRWEFAPRRNT
jgi:hypothetical protein